MSAQPDAGAKLWASFEPNMRGLINELKEHNTALAQTIQIACGRIENSLQVVIKVVEENGKPKARAKKADAVEAPAGAPVAAVAAGEPVAAGVVPPKKLASNSYTHFTAKFKEDPEFRAKILNIPALKELMDKEESIVKKKTPEDKIIPQGKFAWNWIKNGAPDIHKAVTDEYEELKNAAKPVPPAPQAKEPATPPTEPAK